MPKCRENRKARLKRRKAYEKRSELDVWEKLVKCFADMAQAGEFSGHSFESGVFALAMMKVKPT